MLIAFLTSFPCVHYECLCDPAVLLFPVEESTKEVVAIAAKNVGSLSDKEFVINFNTDVFQPHVKHAEPEVCED